MKRWQNIQNVVVVGLGITGLSVVNHLLKLEKELNVKVIDTRPTPPGAEQLDRSVPLHSGGWQTDWLASADLVVASPGIALSTPEIQTVLASGVPVVGDIELFAWSVTAPVIAITGSNGKSTVTDLAGVLAKASGVNVGVGGNIGVPALDLLEQPAELYILELSSFQLETTYSLQLQAAAFLNLSEDHMDRYPDMQAYRQAKLRIFDHANFLVVNREDKMTYPTKEKQSSLEQTDKLITFGTDNKEFGLVNIDGIEWLSESGQAILPTNELSLVGQHNMVNVLTVWALLKSAGIDYRQQLQPLREYQGLTHRCQIVANKLGVKWVNDSKATNVASTLAALSGLNISGTLHLLVGGVGKGADFSELAPALTNLKVKLYCYGRDAEQFLPLHPSASKWDSVADIVQQVSQVVRTGDMVMLSPACASFDQFDNFMARGEAFTQLATQYA